MMNQVNLIPMARRDAKRRRAAMRRWLLICTMYALLLPASFTARYLFANGGNQAVANNLNDVASQIAESKLTLASLKPQLVEAQRTLAANRAVSRQPDWSLLLGLIAQTLGDDVVLRNCQLNPVTEHPTGAQTPEDATTIAAPDQYLLQISGLGRTQAAVSQFILRLEQLQLFDRVNLISTAREPFGAGRAFGFQVECELSRQGGEAK